MVFTAFMVSKLSTIYDMIPTTRILIIENLAATYDPNWMTNLLEELLEETEADNELTMMMTVNTSQTSSMPEDCRLEVWQCMSGVLETGIRYVETPRVMFR